MEPDESSHPFLLLDVGVGIVDELTDMSEGLSSPIPQLRSVMFAEAASPFGRLAGFMFSPILRFAMWPYAKSVRDSALIEAAIPKRIMGC